MKNLRFVNFALISTLSLITLTSCKKKTVEYSILKTAKVRVLEVDKTSSNIPQEYIGSVMELCQEKRGNYINMEFIDILKTWIYDYCKRHNYIVMEIDWKRRLVFYYLKGQSMFDDYTNFNYTKIDLFN